MNDDNFLPQIDKKAVKFNEQNVNDNETYNFVTNSAQ